jgi:hypothetical protein
MANSAAELRDLARQIGHSAFSIAYPIIVNACNHLRTAARVHDCNAIISMIET